MEPSMNQPQRMEFYRVAVLGLLLVASFFWLGFALRFLSFPVLLLAWVLYFKRKPAVRPAIIALLLFFPLTFSPIDVRPIHRSWPPKLVPLVMGLPRPETVERAKRGEVILGGCIVTGFEPKYYLVW